MFAIDLFCGVGGLSAGFKEAGWQIAASNDVDADALETYRLNFPRTKVFSRPIEDLPASELLATVGASPGELDCLIGGPPCQAFSINNHKRSIEDYRASLVSHYLRLVDALHPRHILIENVPGMLTVSGENPLTAILDKLNHLGYICAPAIIAGHELGLPQTRKRLFVLASRTIQPRLVWRKLFGSKAKVDPIRLGAESWHPHKPKIARLEDAISDLPILENGGGSFQMEYASDAKLTEYQRRARKGSSELYNHVCSGLGEINLQRLRFIAPGQNWRAIPEHLLPSGMKRARKSDHTKRYGRLAWTGLAGTILTKCDPHWGAYFHPDQDRVISVREAARIQGFQDRFRFSDNGLTAQYRGIGNAVPPLIAAKIAKALRHVGS